MVRLASLMAAMIVLATPGMAQHRDEARTLNTQVHKLYGEGKYAEAIPIARRVLAIREKTLGPDHLDVGTSSNDLAELYRGLSRFAEAEPLFKRAISIYEQARAPHAHLSQSLNNLAELYQVQGRYADAEPLHKRALGIREKALGPEHPDVAVSLNNLGRAVRGPRPLRRGRTARQALTRNL